MESVLPGGIGGALGDVGGGALGGALNFENPMAPPSSTSPDAPATGPNLPLGF